MSTPLVTKVDSEVQGRGTRTTDEYEYKKRISEPYPQRGDHGGGDRVSCRSSRRGSFRLRLHREFLVDPPDRLKGFVSIGGDLAGVLFEERDQGTFSFGVVRLSNGCIASYWNGRSENRVFRH